MGAAWRGRTGVGGARLALGIALALLGPAGAAGQSIEGGVGIARTQNPAVALSSEPCPADRTWAAEGRGSLRFSRVVSLEATLAYHWENAGDCTPEPIPDTGPHEVTVTEFEHDGYPFLATDARLAFEPANPAGVIWFRAFGGYGRMWSKDVGYWLAGAGLVFGGELEALLDFEWNWFDLPVDVSTESYVDGVLVDSRVESLERSHSTFRIKAGLRFRP